MIEVEEIGPRDFSRGCNVCTKQADRELRIGRDSGNLVTAIALCQDCFHLLIGTLVRSKHSGELTCGHPDPEA